MTAGEIESLKEFIESMHGSAFKTAKTLPKREKIAIQKFLTVQIGSWSAYLKTLAPTFDGEEFMKGVLKNF